MVFLTRFMISFVYFLCLQGSFSIAELVVFPIRDYATFFSDFGSARIFALTSNMQRSQAKIYFIKNLDSLFHLYVSLKEITNK